MKFKVNDKVKVVNYEGYNGKIGAILDVHFGLDIEVVYTVKYEGSNNKGMFPESKLELILR